MLGPSLHMQKKKEYPPPPPWAENWDKAISCDAPDSDFIAHIQ